MNPPAVAMALSGRVPVAVTRSRGALPFSGKGRLSLSVSFEAFIAYVECNGHVCSPYPASSSSRLGHPRHPHYPKTLHHNLSTSPHGPTLLTRSLHTSTAWFHNSRPPGDQPPPDSKSPVVRKPMYRRVMDEVKHYYHGFRQLAVNTGEARAMVWRLLQGKSLKRSEWIRLKKTRDDLVRLVPFVPFVVVPFAELLLPVAVTLFPNMLPSPFEKASDKVQRRQQAAEVKRKLREFIAGHSHPEVPEEDVEALTLENLDRPRLMALCKLLELQPIGPNNLLRTRLLTKMEHLKADDQLIVEEGGPKALSVDELEAACHHRGMPSVGLTEEQLRQQLKRWLDLHLDENVPIVVLLSRAFRNLSENVGPPPLPPPPPKSAKGSDNAHSAAAVAIDESLADPAPNIKDASQEEALGVRAPSLVDDKPPSPAQTVVAKEATAPTTCCWRKWRNR